MWPSGIRDGNSVDGSTFPIESPFSNERSPRSNESTLLNELTNLLERINNSTQRIELYAYSYHIVSYRSWTRLFFWFSFCCISHVSCFVLVQMCSCICIF